MRVLAATADGVWSVGAGASGAEPEAAALAGRDVADLVAVPGGWRALAGPAVFASDGRVVAELTGPAATCLAAAGGREELLVGTEGAHLLRVAGGEARPEPGFDEADGRARWYTPWGGPPDTRTIAVAGDGTVYVNVHVGGVLRSEGDGRWVPTVDIDADVHQVLVVPGDDDHVVAATALGLATSRDRGANWTFTTGGLHGTYARAVAVAGDWLLMSASTGPYTDRAAVYRRPLGAAADEPFEPCASGLPAFTENIDTGSLVGSPSGQAVVAGPDGRLWASSDAGAAWEEAACGLPPVRRLVLPTG